jgi:hypothetical protein
MVKFSHAAFLCYPRLGGSLGSLQAKMVLVEIMRQPWPLLPDNVWGELSTSLTPESFLFFSRIASVGDDIIKIKGFASQPAG